MATVDVSSNAATAVRREVAAGLALVAEPLSLPVVVVQRSHSTATPLRSLRWFHSLLSRGLVALGLRKAAAEFSEQACPLLHSLILLIPWFLLLSASGEVASHGLGWVLHHRMLLGFGLLLMMASGAAALRDLFRGGGGLGLLLAALAFLAWHLGIQTTTSLPSQRRLALVQAPSVAAPMAAAGSCSSAVNFLIPDHQHAAVGLMLLDDVFRAILRFVANTPTEVWRLAVANRMTHCLWVSDEDWWNVCYHNVNWLNLPLNPKLKFFRRDGHPSSRRLLMEAGLWASMAAETLGMMVILPPRCAASSWAAVPCVASTLLLASCSPWLPQQSDMVLIAMLQLMRVIGRFAVYFQFVWIVVIGLLLEPEDLALCALPEGNFVLGTLETAGLMLLYGMVVSRLWATTTLCRRASPLYAVPTDAEVAHSSFGGRTLYCGCRGVVEGSHAPTRMCNWEDLGELQYCDRYALRRSAESLTAKEAQLLSCLDALEVRIREAEDETTAHPWPHMPRMGCTPRSILRAMNGALAALVMALCMLMMTEWRSSCKTQHRISSFDSSGSMLGTVLWASVLLRMGRCWYSIVVQSAAAWDVQANHTSQLEVADLRRQAITLHRSLAETQRTICHLEVQLSDLGVAVQRTRVSWLALSPSGAVRALALCWLSSVPPLALLPYVR